MSSKGKRDYAATKAELELEGVPDLLKRWHTVGECLMDLEDDEMLGNMWEGDKRCNDKPASECGCVLCDLRQLVRETTRALQLRDQVQENGKEASSS